MGWSHYFRNFLYAQLEFTRSGKEKVSMNDKCLIDVRGQRRMGRLVQDDRMVTVTQRTTEECRIPALNTLHIRITLKKMAYSSRRPNRCHSCLIRTGKSGYYWHRLTKTGKLLHSDGIVKSSHKRHKSMDPYCLVSMVLVV